MNTRANFVRGMVNDAYDYAMESYSERPLVFPEIYDMESSGGAYEQYTTVVGPGKLNRRAESQTIPRVNTTEGFTVWCANFKYPVELAISNEAIDDNRKIKSFLKTWAQGLGDAARITQEDEHADLFNYGGYTSGHATFNNDIPGGVLSTGYGNLCYDTFPFFNTDDNLRAAKSGLEYYNGVLNLQLNEVNIQQLFNLLTVTNSYDEAGKRVEIMPDTLLVKYGSDNWFAARRIIESPSSVDGAHAGVTNLWKSQLRVIGWSALIDDNFWTIGSARKGLKSLARLPLTIDFYEDKPNDGQVVRARVRFGRAVCNFRYWVAANFSQS